MGTKASKIMRDLKLNIERALVKKDKKLRAAELVIINKEVAFQNIEKGKRAAELVIANKELIFQNEEKEKRAAELVVANKELVFQNEEKEKRAAELVISNAELVYQIAEKEKRTVELASAHKDLETFNFISSHNIQEPLRKIQIFSNLILSEEIENLSIVGKRYFRKIQAAALHTQSLIRDVIAYKGTNASGKFEKKNLSELLQEVKLELEKDLQLKQATITLCGDGELKVIPFLFRKLLKNLISNSLKFSRAGQPACIDIKCTALRSGSSTSNNILLRKDCFHISITDNGIGFNAEHKDRIFEMFQRLNVKDKYEGTGMGLTLAKKIIELHGGMITANGQVEKGTTIDVYIPS